MRKFFSLLLMGMLLLTAFTAQGEGKADMEALMQTEGYEFCEIPWDTAQDKIVDAFYEKLGWTLELEPESNPNSDLNSFTYVLSSKQPASFSGFAVNEASALGMTQQLCAIGISFASNEVAAGSEEAILTAYTKQTAIFSSMYNDLFEKYGACDDAYILFKNGEENKNWLSLTREDPGDSWESLTAYALTVDSASVSLYWKNIELNVGYHPTDNSKNKCALTYTLPSLANAYNLFIASTSDGAFILPAAK